MSSKAVIGIPDVDMGEAVTAVVVAQSDHWLTESAVIAALKADIAGQGAEAGVLCRSSAAYRAMGKVRKRCGPIRDRIVSNCQARPPPID